MMYTLTVSKKQLQVIQKALNLFARVQLGQWREIDDHLPLKGQIDYADLYAIGKILSKYMDGGMNGINSSYGIGHPKLPESNSIAFDIHDVIRHKLSWEYAIEQGWVNSEDDKRQNNLMLGVNYERPFKWSRENLPVLKRVT